LVDSISSPFSAAGPVVLEPYYSDVGITISFKPTTDGVIQGTATLDLVAQDPTRPTVTLPSRTIAITATVYKLATPGGGGGYSWRARVGDGLQTGSLSFSNGATADPYQENLIVTPASGVQSPFTIGGSISVASGQTGQIPITFAPGGPGLYSDSDDIFEQSQNIDPNVLNSVVGSGPVFLTGVVFAPAIPVLPSSLNLGIMHVGDNLSGLLTATNAGQSTLFNQYSDSLHASVISLSPGFNAPYQDFADQSPQYVPDYSRSTAADIAPGHSGQVIISADTSQAGVLTGTAQVSFVSHDRTLADESLPTASVELSATINNYAAASLVETSGGGTWSQTGTNAYTLDLGTISGATSIGLAADNSATGPADLLGGAFQIAGDAVFVNTGFGSFSGIAAGGAQSGLSVNVAPTQDRTFSETITLSPYGANASGYKGALSPITLTVKASVAITSFTVTSEAELDQDLANISAGGVDATANTSYVFNLAPGSGLISLTQGLTPLNMMAGSSLTLTGAGVTIDGQGHTGFSVANPFLTVQGVNLENFGPGGAMTASYEVALSAQANQVQKIAGIDGGSIVAVTGAGTVDLIAASTYNYGTYVSGRLELSASGAAGYGPINLDSTSTLIVDNGVSVDNLIAGLSDGASIDAAGLENATASLDFNLLTITSGARSLVLTLAEPTYLSAYGLSTTSDNNHGTIVSYTAPTTRHLAIASVPSTLNLGALHVADYSPGSLTIQNTALQGAESLIATASAGAPFYNFFTTLGLAPGESYAFSVIADTSHDGALSGTETLALTSHNNSGADQALTTASVAVSATVYAYASPLFANGLTVSLGSARVGDAALTGSTTLENGSTADSYQETLAYQLNSISSGLSASGTTSGTLASGASTQIGLSLSTATAGAFNDTVDFAATSQAFSGSGLTDTARPDAIVTVSAKVFAQAVASLATNSINFGIVHVGDATGQMLGVSNAATGALSDTLVGGFSSVSPGFVGAGSINVAGGGSGSLLLQLNTSKAGSFSGSATVALASHDTDLSDLALATQTVNLTGTVLNYAALGLQLTGGIGHLTGSGGAYTLDLGAVYAGDTATLNIFNAANGPADNLGATFNATGSSDFSNTGLAAFGGAGGGQTGATPTITISAQQGGAVSEVITIHGTDSNAGGYMAAMSDVTVTVRANVVGGVYPTITVTNEAELNAAIAAISQGGGSAGANTTYTIALAPPAGNTIALTSDIAPINLLAGSSLTIVGNGATLDGQGAYQGFTVQNGAVTLQNLTVANALDGASLQGATNLTLDPSAGQTVSIGGPIADQSGTSTLTVEGQGQVVLGNQATYAGTISIASGAALRISSDPTQTTGAIHDAGTLIYGAPGSGAVANLIDGAGKVSVALANGNSLTLSGALDWTGTTSIAAGSTLVLASDTSHLTGAISDAGTLALDTPAATTLSATIFGVGSLAVLGGQAVTLGALNSFTGGVTLAGGALTLASSVAAGTGTIQFESGANATLFIGAGDAPSNVISGFAPGDTLDLAGFDPSTTTAVLESNNVLAISDATHTVDLNLDAGSQAYGYHANVSSDGVAITATPFNVKVPDELHSLPAQSTPYSFGASSGLLWPYPITNPCNIPLFVTGIREGATVGTVGSDFAGTYGTLHLASDGSFTYAIGATAAEQQALANAPFNQTAAETFGFTVSDAAGDTRSAKVTFNVNRPVSVSGYSADQTATDESNYSPFSTAQVANPDHPSEVLDAFIQISTPFGIGGATPYGNGHSGDFLSSSLPPDARRGNFVDNIGPTITYNFSGTPDQLTADIRALVFRPDAHIVAPGSSVTTTFDLIISTQNANYDAQTNGRRRCRRPSPCCSDRARPGRSWTASATRISTPARLNSALPPEQPFRCPTFRRPIRSPFWASTGSSNFSIPPPATTATRRLPMAWLTGRSMPERSPTRSRMPSERSRMPR
jgi:VCBS repeat-containing protein